MNWWRAHHGISNDSKLGVVAIRSKARLCEVGWIWVILLDFASQSSERGSILGLDNEQIALMAGMEEDQVSEIIGQLRQRGLIQQDGTITAWHKRQPLREREDETAAERKRRQRAKSRQVTLEIGNVTPGHAQIRLEQNRTEENIKTNTPAPDGACPPKPLNPLLALGWLGGWKWVKNTTDEMCSKIVELRERDFDPSEDLNSPVKIWARLCWFEEFWGAYWLSKGKKRAREIYMALVPTTDDHDKVMMAVDAQSPEMMAKPEDKRPHATTWLNGARWEDKAMEKPNDGFSLESIQ